MGMTLAERIIAENIGAEEVHPGEIVNANVDYAMGEDATVPLAIEAFVSLNKDQVFNQDRISFVGDHSVPYPSVSVAEQAKKVRAFCERFGIHLWEPGEVGVEHVLLPEQGLVIPGDVVVGADSHTTTYGALGAFAVGVGSTDLAGVLATGKIWLKVPETLRIEYFGQRQPWVMGKDLILHTIGKIGTEGANYRAMEFCGEVVGSLPMDDRFTLCNMAAEAGAKAGLIEPDAVVDEYEAGRAKRKYKKYKSDFNATYERDLKVNVSNIDCQVSIPFSPANAVNVTDLDRVVIDQVFIGSCTNGRMEDFKVAAEILKGKTKASRVRLIVIPSTPSLFKRLIENGLMSIFLEAGAVIGPPTCGPCYGGHMGLLAKGEKAVSTSNRNFKGRMGHLESEVYLANPAVAAASAIAGIICHPSEIIS